MQWEYKSIKIILECKMTISSAVYDEAAVDAALNRLGDEGWELVSTVKIYDAGLFGTNKEITAFLKRPKR
jgi:hypothetical protein